MYACHSQTVDTNLPLGGAYSVAGRSVVIHDSSSPPAKWKCTNLIWDTRTMNGTLLRAKANFVGEIQGYIEMVSIELFIRNRNFTYCNIVLERYLKDN